MGTFVTDPTEELFDDKEHAPGVSLRSGWTANHVTSAADMNALRDAAYDLRTKVIALQTEVDAVDLTALETRTTAAEGAITTLQALPTTTPTANKVPKADGSGIIAAGWLPSSVATLTGSQTLTNKTLTSPAITGATLTGTTSLAATTLGGTLTATGQTISGGTLSGVTLSGASNTVSAIATASLASTATAATASTIAVRDSSGDLTARKHLSTYDIVAAHRRPASAQVLGTGAYTVVDYSTSEVDTHSAVTTGAAWKFTVPAGAGGNYVVSGTVTFETGGVFNKQFVVHKNGSFERCLCIQNGSDAYRTLTGTCVLLLAAGDFVDFRAWHDRGSNANIDSTAGRSFCSIHRLSGA